VADESRPPPTPAIARHDFVRSVSLPLLFIDFLKVGLCGFGGGLVWARRMVVDRRGWLNEQEFADLLSLCQFMPGPNVASITVCVGARLRGAPGAVAALAGFILVPWIVGFSLGVLLLDHAHNAILQRILIGISAAAAGLMIGTGGRLLLPYRTHTTPLIFAALALGLALFVKLPLLAVLLAVAPLSIVTVAYQGGRAR
jgi:chromate transporter